LICDCDVIEADGGTRTASITGAFVALALALRTLQQRGVLERDPIRSPVAAVSVGLVPLAPEGQAIPLLDLQYQEDRRAVVDLNVVELFGAGLVEVQGTGEQGTFSRAELNTLLDLAERGLAELFRLQQRVLAEA
jgi:ribonuclease PH